MVMNRHGWEFRNAERALEPEAVLLGGRDQMLTEATWQNRVVLAIRITAVSNPSRRKEGNGTCPVGLANRAVA